MKERGICFLIGYPEKDACRWSEAGVSRFDLLEREKGLRAQWKALVHPDEWADFTGRYDGFLEGRAGKFVGEYRLKLRGGAFGSHLCVLWRGESDLPSEPACIIGLILPPEIPWVNDPVTDLPSKYDFRRALSARVAEGEPCSLLLIEIDNFGIFNENYSYTLGNRVLACCAGLLRGLLPPKALMFRSEGDGFYLLFPHWEFSAMQDWFGKAQPVLQQPHEIDGTHIYFTVSAGLCRFPEDGADADAVCRNLSLTLRSLKAEGRGRIECYSEEMGRGVASHTRLLACVRESIAMNFRGFSMRYQPLMRAQGGGLCGCEALLRWSCDEFPELSIQECVSCLEESGLIKDVGRFVLENAIRQCAEWVQKDPDFCMNINVAYQQFEEPNFGFFVLELLEKYRLSPEHIILELTESGKVKNADKLETVFNFLRGQRIRVSFDDFGTGYASLDIFRKLSADELKIDRSFLERVTYNVTDQALVATLIDLCHKMNMLVCVEGIETPELEHVVGQMEPDFLQGYFYARPITVEEFEEKYFCGDASFASYPQENHPELENSMAYAALRPVQPLSLSEIIDHSFAGIFQVGMDAEFTFLTCNEGYRRMLGYTASEIEKKFKNRALGFVHPDDIVYVNEEIRRQLGEGDTVTIEFRIQRKDGASIWIVGTGNVYRAQNGSSSLVVVIVDNDKAKRKQLADLKDHWIYKKLLTSLPTGIKLVRYDPEFTIDYISPGFLELLGYTYEEIETKFDGKYINLIVPEDRQSVFNDIMEQLKKSDVVTMRYRTPCKDGKRIWVETVSRLCEPDADGIQRACSSVVNITDHIFAEPDRGLNIANRFETAATQWGEFLFEYNLKTDSFSFSDNMKMIFDAKDPVPFSAVLDHVHEQDRALLLLAAEESRAGRRPEPFEMRMIFPDEESRWLSVAFSAPEKFGEIPVSVLGKLTDVDRQRREREHLILQAKRDPLTNLLNKSATESRIRELLGSEPKTRFAMFMLDVDGFKQINDILGHLSGDEALSGLAEILQKKSGPDDVVGRVGGDEFMIFSPCARADGRDIEERAQDILRDACELLISDGDTEKAISVSIGISFYPENGTRFYDLFRCADSAMYRAKELGRNQYCLAANS